MNGEPLRPDPDFVGTATEDAALRYASQRSGTPDYRVAQAIGVSAGYMSKILSGKAGLSGPLLVAFMRATGSLVPLQWLADQAGCAIVPRGHVDPELADLRRQIEELERGRSAA